MTEETKQEEPRDESSLSYVTPWVANGLSWSPRSDKPFRLAISSYIQDYKNYVDIVERDAHGSLVHVLSWEHCYPLTKLMFPPKQIGNGDFVITTADYLRLWEVTEEAPEAAGKPPHPSSTDPPAPPRPDAAGQRATLKHCFDGEKSNDFCSPVTSCDWNGDATNIVGCCSIDSTVTIWDLVTGQQRTKLVAHDKDVYDIAFASANTFVSCSADGSVRFFDLRDMDHSTILYESQGLSPLLRVACNQQDPNYISTFGVESASAVVIDIRFPSVPASFLCDRHTLPINGMAWSPQSAQNICTVGEDGVVCIWGANADVGESLFQYTCGLPIHNVAWRQTQDQNWIAITTSEGAQLLRL